LNVAADNTAGSASAPSHRIFRYPVRISFGDCDPAGIVFYPNFFRWFDAATHALFASVGQDTAQIAREHGLVAWPLVDAGAKFRAPARHGETVEVQTRITEWRDKTFVLEHRIVRAETLIAEGWEIRFVGQTVNDSPPRLRAVSIPAWMRQALD
jgi:4-hydroxybenzoyl-CoA thioesterase